MSTARVDFTRGAAERIARVVRIVEQGDRNQSGPTWDAVDGGGGSTGSSGKVFRICTFTGSWNIDTAKTVSFRGVTTTPNTVVAVNLFASLNPATGATAATPCAIAKDGTAWYLIQARC